MDRREHFLMRWVGNGFALALVVLFLVAPVILSYMLVRDGYWWGIVFVLPLVYFGYRFLPLVIWPRSSDDRTLVERLIDWREDRHYPSR
jgi:hypothetical protein